MTNKEMKNNIELKLEFQRSNQDLINEIDNLKESL